MAESVFWRDLEQRFRLVQAACGDSMQAKWMESTSGSTGDHWRVEGAAEPAMKMFTWLADRAAIELGHEGHDATYWLDLLKRDSPYCREIALQHWDSDSQGIKSVAGVILRVCGASAEYCITCEGLMLARCRRKDEAQMMPELATSAAKRRSSNLGVPSERKKPGPKTDIETASKVAKVVAEIAPFGEWKGHWEQICEALDDAQIPVPRAWRRKQGLRRWADCDVRE
jgi:hypothetical protein